ncbi:MAG: trimeric intracellular cation channel family protein [Spirochaetales bacterium]|uniref:Trimeric intracellular cation channel family protein n=1 Tax=Candidatus Thalassospirochaeta sargassi TaxID=3119039 RepID=A0AAJ1IEV4_9SPIO|nr:trimeric intracellular cation channel family protein [Spirochaetales bacterium]
MFDSIFFLDIFGSAVFAVAGTFKAIKHELDILGVITLALITGVGGGILRDLLLGDAPPAAFRDETYFIVCIISGLAAAVLASRIARVWKLVKVFDALGLGVFTAIGAAKGMEYGLGYVGILLTGAITATGGGMIRDVLVREIPSVISRDFYATASFLGSIALIAVVSTGAEEGPAIIAAIVVTTVVRLVAMKTGLALPKVKRIPWFRGTSEDSEG